VAGGGGLGCLRAIPNDLELEAKSNRRAIWVKPMQNAFQKLSEVANVRYGRGWLEDPERDDLA